jgi:hypothetical protein
LSCTLSPYLTIVNEDGSDNGLVGDAFYVYFAFTPEWDDWMFHMANHPGWLTPNDGLQQLVRQKVTLVAPSGP